MSRDMSMRCPECKSPLAVSPILNMPGTDIWCGECDYKGPRIEFLIDEEGNPVRMVTDCVITSNGNVMSFGADSQQVLEAQGFIFEIAERLKILCDANTKFQFGKRTVGLMDADFKWWFEKHTIKAEEVCDSIPE